MYLEMFLSCIISALLTTDGKIVRHRSHSRPNLLRLQASSRCLIFGARKICVDALKQNDKSSENQHQENRPPVDGNLRQSRSQTHVGCDFARSDISKHILRLGRRIELVHVGVFLISCGRSCVIFDAPLVAPRRRSENLIRQDGVVAVQWRRERFICIRSRGTGLCCEGRIVVGKWCDGSVHSAKGMTVEWLVVVRGKRRGPHILFVTISSSTLRRGRFCEIGHSESFSIRNTERLEIV